MKSYSALLALIIALGAIVFYTTDTSVAPPAATEDAVVAVNNSYIPEPKLLVFSKTEGYRHDSIATGVKTLVELGKTDGFSVVATEDAELFTDQSLSTYQAVVFLNTTGDVLNEEQQVAFERYIQAGGGFVGIHSAADTEWDTGTVWPWYQRLVGGIFNGHPEDNNQLGELTVRDASHPATAKLPAQWAISDEWYDYRRLSAGIKVLMTLDEDSYEGATMGAGEHHPVAWYRDFDGGRSFYTTLGHHEAVYQDENFLNLISGGIAYARGNSVTLDYSKSRPEPWRFTRKVLDSSLNEPLKITFSPAGELYFIERTGQLRRYDFTQQKAVTVHRFEDLYTYLEYGLLGLAFDPEYASNHWLYLFRTVKKGDAGEHVLSRFKLIDHVLDEASEQVLLTMPAEGNDAHITSHTGGDMQFDKAGNLWLSTGDDTDADENANIDDRPGFYHQDAARSAGNTQDLRGKILRIKPRANADSNGRYYDIPDGNLFASAEGRPEIYVMGLRNPYTIAYDDRRQRIYWGEVGPDAQGDSDRGPMGFDEINFAEQPGNFGWPFVIADNQPYAYYDYRNQVALDKANVQAPENRSRNNTGLKILPPAQPAWIYYPYKFSDEFFELDSGGRNALVAPVYYSDEITADSRIKFPSYFDGKLIISDFIRRWIMVVETDAQGRPESIVPLINHAFSAPLDMAFGPDGALYVVEYGTDWFSGNVDSYISRIEYYSGDNPPPVPVATASKTTGAAPLVTTLDASESWDRGADDSVLTYRWQLVENGKPGQLLGTDMRQSITLEGAGEKYVQLTVTDGGGESASTLLRFEIGNDRPEIDLDFAGNRSFFFANQNLKYAVRVTDTEDGSSENGSQIAADVKVSFGYVGGGEDLARALAQQTVDPLLEGKTLVESGSDCHACHRLDGESIGPSYTQISQRYQSKANATEYIQQVIANGGSGQWEGNHAMPAHPKLDQSQLQYISAYILSLAASDTSEQHGRLGLNGTLSFDQHLDDFIDLKVESRGPSMNLGRQYSGRYIFSVSYTDKGAPGAGALQGQETIILRSPIILAHEIEETVGLRGAGVGNGLKTFLPRAPTALAPFSYALIRKIDLTGIDRIKVYAAAVKPMMSGGLLELRLDDSNSAAVATANIPAQDAPRMDENPAYLDVSGISGVHDLYIGVGLQDNGSSKPPFAMMGMEFLP